MTIPRLAIPRRVPIYLASPRIDVTSLRGFVALIREVVDDEFSRQNNGKTRRAGRLGKGLA